MDDENFLETLDEVTRYVIRVDDQVQQEFEATTADGEEVKGFVCDRATHAYQILGSGEWEHFVVRYPFHLDQTIALREKMRETGQQQPDLTQDDLQHGRETLSEALGEKSGADLRELRLNLMELLSKEGCVLTMDTTQQVRIHGFAVGKHIYPQEADFGISDFNDAVQTVINLGWVGRDFLAENYNLTRDVSTESGGGDLNPGTNDAGSKGFQ